MKALGRVLRVTLVYVALGALGCWSIWAQLAYRTPSRWIGVLLSGLAVASTGLTFAFGLRALFGRVGAKARRWSPVAVASRVCALAILGFGFYGVFLFTNGTLDAAEPTHHPTEIVRIGLDETEVSVRVPVVWADLRSWRRPGELERILVHPDERERLWSGQAVMVSVRRGFYGVPWVVRIQPDLEKLSREVLAALPDAGQVRKDLAGFYIRLGRFTEAAMTAREYARRFPDDREFPVQIARLLTSRDRFADVVVVLADVEPRREDADVAMLFGYALAMQGRLPEGLGHLERARAMQPRHWWPHYALGRAYASAGDYARAVASFQRAVELRPGLHDAERELQRLRPLAAKKST
jgi:tetratricopeptide (TPR) repeat protein